MWAQALDLLERAERMHRQFSQPNRLPGGRPCWEPPVDIFETSRELMVMTALPGVAAGDIHVAFDGRTLRIAAERALPVAAAGAIRRLEIPHGRFERRIELGDVGLDLARQEFANGCLLLLFRKQGVPGV